MSVVETGFQISAEVVAGVRDDVVAKPLKTFREEELPHMLPGMTAFELGMFEDACKFDGPESTGFPMRVGLLVAHRALRLANENQPLPQEIDARLGEWAGKVVMSSLLEPPRVERNCREVRLAYQDSPGVQLLFDDILRMPASQAGATLLLGLHIPLVNPSSAVPHMTFKEVAAASQRPARPKRGFYGGGQRHR